MHSSGTLTKRPAAIFKKNRLGDYGVIFTSTATNQHREFSIIIYMYIYVIILRAISRTLCKHIGINSTI